jgi:hypothetical protein
MARQAALLLLTVHGYEIPLHTVDNDFYRQALELDLRGKREYTEVILNAMGGIGKMRLSQYKRLLNLSDEALKLADRHSLDERILRPILGLPSESHAEMIQQCIQLNLTARQVVAIIEEGVEASNKDKRTTTPEVKLAHSISKVLDKQNPRTFAEAMVVQHGDTHMAYAYLNRLEQFIKHAKEALED